MAYIFLVNEELSQTVRLSLVQRSHGLEVTGPLLFIADRTAR